MKEIMEIIRDLKSVWLFLKTHPDNEAHSEMRDRLIDVDSVIRELEKFPRWKETDPGKLPKGEVIARYKDEILIGYFGEDLEFYISDETYVPNYPTHYIPVSELLNLETE